MNYSGYYLTENPFPESPSIDQGNPDPRVNGSIFYYPIFQKEIEALTAKTEQGLNVVYLTGTQYDRGIGKSALMIHHLRTLKKKAGSACAYIRCESRDKPVDAAKKTVISLHVENYLWEAFKACFQAYCKETIDPMLEREAVSQLCRAHPRMPEKLPLGVYTRVRDPEKVADDLAHWASIRVGVPQEALAPVFGCYLSRPVDLPDRLGKRDVKPIEVLGGCIRLLTSFGYGRVYIFLDQFEDMVMGTAKAGLTKFSLDMKDMVRVCSGAATIFVTLHPSSEQALKAPQVQDFRGVAPIDATQRVDVMLLDKRWEAAVALAEEYFRAFRSSEPPYPTYPVEPELLEIICYLNRGLIRGILITLKRAVDRGAREGYPELTVEYARARPENIFGRVVTEKDLEAFYAKKGKLSNSTQPGKSWRGIVKEFKNGEARSG